MRVRGRRSGALSSAVIACVAAVPLGAQTRALEFDRPESWGMKFNTSISLFSGFGVPEPLEPGAFEISGEVSNIPQLSDAERRIGFVGTKLEDMNKSQVFGRIRARLGLGGGWSAEVGVVPPVTVGGAKPLMFAAAIGGPVLEDDRYRVGLRVHGQYGRVQGDITCDIETVAAGLNSPGNPFNCEEVSDDEAVHRYGGVEVSASLPQGSWEPYVALSGNYIDAEFRVDALYSGTMSAEVLTTSGTTVSAALGAAFEATEALRINVEGFYTPLSVVRPPETASGSQDLFNVRAMVSYRVR
jgi:hypothetical protein